MKYLIALLFVIINISIYAQTDGIQIPNIDISDHMENQKKSLNAIKIKQDGEGFINELLNLLMEYKDTQDLLLRLSIAKEELLFVPNFVNPASINLSKVFKRMAYLYWLLNDNDNALFFIDKAIDVLNNYEDTNRKELADVMSCKCKYQQQLMLYDSAILTGEFAKEIYDSLQIKPNEYMDLLCDLSWAYISVHQYEKALEYQKQAITFYEKVNDWFSLAESLNRIAHSYQSMGKLCEAEYYSQKAVDCIYNHDNAEQHIKNAIVLSGDSSINTPSNIEAVNYRIAIDKSNCLQTLARINFKKGKLDEAILLEKENGNVIRKLKDEEMYSVHLLTISQYYQENHQYAESLACCEQCINIVKEDNNQILGLVRQQMAITHAEMKDYEQAVHLAEESASLFDLSNLKIEKVLGQTSLAYYYYKCGKYDEAETFLATTLKSIQDTIKQTICNMTPEQKYNFWSNYDYIFLMYRNIVTKSIKKDEYYSRLYNFILFSKNLLLDTEMDKEHDELSRFEVSWQDIQNNLTKQDIAIEFISVLEDDREHHKYFALAIDNTCKNPLLIPLYSESDLNKIRQLDLRDVNVIVGELIWKPILTHYGRVKNIYFSADGIFHILPIEYYNYDDARSMFDTYNLYRLSSTKELVVQSGSKLPQSVVLYGGLEYNSFFSDIEDTHDKMKTIAERGSFEPLQNSLLEIQEIGDLLTDNNIATTMYYGEDGTEDSFKKLSGQIVSWIHIATHGMYLNSTEVSTKRRENNFDFLELFSNENSPIIEDVSLTHSFLVMTGGNQLPQRETKIGVNDGILTAKEISMIDLKNLDLVVLSACESALGDLDNNGVFGLQRGFKKAGANTILMSVRKVDDEATRLLMVEFYRNLMSGKTKHQSFKEAQKHLRQVDNGKYDRPEYWASFIMLDGLN